MERPLYALYNADSIEFVGYSDECCRYLNIDELCDFQKLVNRKNQAKTVDEYGISVARYKPETIVYALHDCRTNAFMFKGTCNDCAAYLGVDKEHLRVRINKIKKGKGTIAYRHFVYALGVIGDMRGLWL